MLHSGRVVFGEREAVVLIAEHAMDTWVPGNPRPIPGPAQIREILELAA
jgi:hypothetical protein